jgi:hypothetical protein
MPTLTPLSEKWTAALFAKFRAIYGNKWTDQFSSERELSMAKEEWSQALAELQPNQLKNGISWCRVNLDWPPSISQFYKAAKGTAEGWQHKTAAYKVLDPSKLLPKLRTKEQEVKGGLALKAIKASLKGTAQC